MWWLANNDMRINSAFHILTTVHLLFSEETGRVHPGDFIARLRNVPGVVWMGSEPCTLKLFNSMLCFLPSFFPSFLPSFLPPSLPFFFSLS